MTQVLRCAVVLAALTLCALPAAADAAPRSGFGLQVVPIDGPVPQSAIDADLDLARHVGARLVRVEVTWSAFEPVASGERDPAAVAALDRLAAAARRRGLKLLIVSLHPPCWASAAPATARDDCAAGRSGEAHSYPPADPRDYAAFVAFLAARYSPQLAAIELWNEPDHRNERYWRGPDKIGRYVRMAQAAYPAIKRAAPRVPVLAGAFVGTDGRWLTELYRAGIKGSYDALSVHFYDSTLHGLHVTRRVQRRFGDRRPVWLAETGWSSCRRRGRLQDGHRCVTPAGQARHTRDLVRVLRRTPWVQKVVFYAARDNAAYDFGLVTRAGRHKPVARTLRSELGARRSHPVPRLTARLRPAGGRLVVAGRGFGGELFEIEAAAPGVRYRAHVRVDERGRFRKTLHPAVGTRGVTVTVRSPFTGRRVKLAR